MVLAVVQAQIKNTKHVFKFCALVLAHCGERVAIRTADLNDDRVWQSKTWRTPPRRIGSSSPEPASRLAARCRCCSSSAPTAQHIPAATCHCRAHFIEPLKGVQRHLVHDVSEVLEELTATIRPLHDRRLGMRQRIARTVHAHWHLFPKGRRESLARLLAHRCPSRCGPNRS